MRPKSPNESSSALAQLQSRLLAMSDCAGDLPRSIRDLLEDAATALDQYTATVRALEEAEAARAVSPLVPRYRVNNIDDMLERVPVGEERDSDPPIQRATYSPVVGYRRRELQPGKTYICSHCNTKIVIPAPPHEGT